MNPETGIDLLTQAVWTILVIGGPVLGCLFVSSAVVSLLQASTQLQDQTLSTVPRFVVGGVAVAYFLPWMVDRLGEFAREALTRGFSG